MAGRSPPERRPPGRPARGAGRERERILDPVQRIVRQRQRTVRRARRSIDPDSLPTPLIFLLALADALRRRLARAGQFIWSHRRDPTFWLALVVVVQAVILVILLMTLRSLLQRG